MPVTSYEYVIKSTKRMAVNYVVGIFKECVMSVQFCLYHVFLFH